MSEKIYIFIKKYVASEGAVSHNNLYYQHLTIARYQGNTCNLDHLMKCSKIIAANLFTKLDD